MLTGAVPDDELPELNTPFVTSEANCICLPRLCISNSTTNLLEGLASTHKAACFIASCAEK